MNMNTRKAAAAIAVAILAAAAYPALNRAQEFEAVSDDDVSREVEARLHQEEKIIRRAEAQAQMQAAKAAKVMIQANKEANRNFNIFFKAGEVSMPLAAKISEAAHAVRDAKDEEARKKATERLSSALDEYFEENMKDRGKELDDIRARLAKLEAQLERRRSKKDEIIDLQMKVALNEADGLGFYSGPQDKTFNFPLPPPMPAYTMPDIVVGAPARVEAIHPPAPPTTFPAPVAAPAPAPRAEFIEPAEPAE
jgi:hypothetical protein